MAVKISLSVAIFTFATVQICASLASLHLTGSDANPYKRSAMLHKLASKVNAHPKAKWVAGVGVTPDEALPKQAGFGVDLQSPKQARVSVEGKALPKQATNYPYIVRSDWRNFYPRVLAEPEYQGTCGSCWAFAAVHTFMDNWSIRYGKVDRLSVQHVLECCRFTTCGGCQGAADVAAGLDYLTRYFTVPGYCKPYTESDTFCSWQCGVGGGSFPYRYSLFNLRRLNSNPDEIRAAILNGPVLAGMDVYNDLYTYKGGVYHHMYGDFVTCHAVEIVGFGTVDDGTPTGQDYWAVKNSWGTKWAEEGYFRIAAGTNEVNIESFVVATVFGRNESFVSGEDPAISGPLGGFQETDPSDEGVIEVGKFIANEVNPFCDDGKFDGATEHNPSNFSLEKVLSASQRVDAGKTVIVLIEVSIPQCRVRMFIDAQVHLDLSWTYHLQSHRFIPKENVQMIQRGGGAVGRVRASTVWSAAAIVLAIVVF